MAGFRNFGEYVDGINAGRIRTFSWRKTVTPTTLPGGWLDMSVLPGSPPPQFYATTPLSAATMTGVPGTDGLPYGGNVGGANKRFIHQMLNCSPNGIAACPLLLVDMLMYYPFCDQGTTDIQTMTNNVTLPRYTTGEGVMIMPVLIFPQSVLSDTMTVTYTNSDGVAGRVTALAACNDMTYLGGVLTSTTTTSLGKRGPFLSLQGADKGVRSIQSVQMTNGTDVGIFTLVLVCPLVETQIRELTAPVEFTGLMDRGYMAEFYDGAYLNIIAQPSQNLAGTTMFGLITTTWG